MDMNKGRRIFFDSVPSTNTFLAENADVLKSGDYAVAASQTAGRGRMGRHWEDNVVDGDAGGNVVRDRLFMSVLLKDIAVGASVTKYTLLTAVAVCRAVGKLYGVAPAVKWSNDIMLPQNGVYKKIVGILCESRISVGLSNVVIGIGVNVGGTAEFYADKGYNATSLYAATGIFHDCDEVESAVLAELFPLLELPLSDVLAEYKSRCVTIGRQVRIFRSIESGEFSTAFAEDVDEYGRLVCSNEDGRFTVVAGEVSVRGVDGYV